jgi:hypothetical protein
MKYTLYDNGSPIASGTLTNGTKTIKYIASYVGSHMIQATYNGDTWRTKATSQLCELTVQNTSTTLIHSNGDVYQYTKDYVKLVDSNNEPIQNKPVKYTINGIPYNKVTDNEGYIEMNINLPPNDYPVHVIFNGDTIGYQTSSLDYILRVKDLEILWQPSHTQHGDHQNRTAPYQIWNNLGFDAPSGSGYCTCGYSTNNNEVISSKKGSYHTPDKLNLYDFGFDIPTNAIIKEIKVRVYDRQYNPKGGGFPNIGNATITMLNHDPRVCEKQPVKSNSGYEINEVSWVNPSVVPVELNADTSETHANAFTIGLQYGKNDSYYTGAIMLKYFEVGVRYLLPTVKE